jgi:hypothetical protein
MITAAEKDKQSQSALQTEINSLIDLGVKYEDNAELQRLVNRELDTQVSKYKAIEAANGQETKNALLDKYLRQLDELNIKLDENKNDEQQLLDLNLQREIASINQANATQAEKDAAIAAAQEVYDKKARLAQEELTLGQFLAQNIKETEAQTNFERIEQAKSFLAERLEAEQIDSDTRYATLVEKEEAKLAFLEQQRELLNNVEFENQEYRIAAEKAADDEILSQRKNVTKAKIELMNKELGAVADLYGGMSQLMTAAGKENRAAAVAGKALAAVQAGINTSLAATEALAKGGGVPWGLIPMFATIAAGVAQQIQIASTPIPSAETGGNFIVPDVSPQRVDGGLLRVNPGEGVSITPRGETGGGGNGSQTFNIFLDGNPFIQFINDKIESHEINLTLANV